jgi:hypothetical protein
MIWTKCGYLLGYVAPQSKLFTREQSDAIEKAFFDQMWNVNFADIFQHLDNSFVGSAVKRAL